MRMLLRVRLDTEAGNRAVRDGTVGRVVKEFVAKHQPEAAYFFPDRGRRTAAFIFDMKDPSEIPATVEPLFMEVNGEVELIPVMNLDDLQKGLGVLGH